jgi:hypothetical protein
MVRRHAPTGRVRVSATTGSSKNGSEATWLQTPVADICRSGAGRSSLTAQRLPNDACGGWVGPRGGPDGKRSIAQSLPIRPDIETVPSDRRERAISQKPPFLANVRVGDFTSAWITNKTPLQRSCCRSFPAANESARQSAIYERARRLRSSEGAATP